jgi:hypothetical protein
LQATLGTDVGINIMVRFIPLQWSAAAMLAAAIIASTTAPGWAFTQEMLQPGQNGNYNFNYSGPDNQAATGQSTPTDPNSPGLHFNIQQGQMGPFGGFQSGDRSLDNGGDPTNPNFYIQPRGNGN